MNNNNNKNNNNINDNKIKNNNNNFVVLPYNLFTKYVIYNCSTKCPLKSFWALSFNWKHIFGCCPTQYLLFGNLIKYSWNIRELEKNKFSTLKPSKNIVGSNLNKRKKTSWGWSCAKRKFSWGWGWCWALGCGWGWGEVGVEV